MDVKVINDEVGVVVIAFSEIFDEEMGDELIQELQTQMMNGVKNVIIDFTSLQFLYTTGLEILESKIQEIIDLGGSFSVVVSEAKIEEAVQLFELSKMIDIHETLDIALENVRCLPPA